MQGHARSYVQLLHKKNRKVKAGCWSFNLHWDCMVPSSLLTANYHIANCKLPHSHTYNYIITFPTLTCWLLSVPSQLEPGYDTRPCGEGCRERIRTVPLERGDKLYLRKDMTTIITFLWSHYKLALWIAPCYFVRTLLLELLLQKLGMCELSCHMLQ